VKVQEEDYWPLLILLVKSLQDDGSIKDSIQGPQRADGCQKKFSKLVIGEKVNEIYKFFV
jgi:hypothetical protein